MAQPINRWNIPMGLTPSDYIPMPRPPRLPAALRTRASLAKESREKRGPLPKCPGCGYPNNDFKTTHCEVCSIKHVPALFAGREPTYSGLMAEADEHELEGKRLAAGGYAHISKAELMKAIEFRKQAEALPGRPVPASPNPGGEGLISPQGLSGWQRAIAWLVPPRLLRFFRIIR